MFSSSARAGGAQLANKISNLHVLMIVRWTCICRDNTPKARILYPKMYASILNQQAKEAGQGEALAGRKESLHTYQCQPVSGLACKLLRALKQKSGK